MQPIVWPLRFLLLVAVASVVLTIERFVLPSPRVPTSWLYWVLVAALIFEIQMWTNDLLAHFGASGLRGYELQYDDNSGRSVPIPLRLMIIYPVVCAGLAYALWYMRNFPMPSGSSPPA